MKFRIRIFTTFALATIVVMLLLAPPISYATQQSQYDHEDYPAYSTPTAIHISKSDETGILFELNTSPFFVADDGSIAINGLEEKFIDAGSPALPYFSTFIALPPSAEVSIVVKESGLTHHSPHNVLPAPQTRLWGEEPKKNDTLAFGAGSIRELNPEFVENQSIYNLDAKFPGVSSLLSDPMVMRDMQMVELKLFPLQYNPTSKTVTQASNLIVKIEFSGSSLDGHRTAASYTADQEPVWQEKIINYDQGRTWRTLPQNISDTGAVKLPIGTKTYKIDVDQDGIYEILGSDLAARGMDLPVDPATIQMMQGGKSVAYQFVDTDNNQQFDAVDKIRFYGWAFDGSRQEKLYVTNNVFWLWAGGDARHIPRVSNQTGSGTIVTSFHESITEWKESYFHSAWSIVWDVNDPTLWHTKHFQLEPGKTISESLEIDLPNPDPNANDVTYLVELTTNLRKPTRDPSTTSFEAKTFLNNSAQFGESAWIGPKNLNVINTVAGNMLKKPGDAGYPTNQMTVKIASNNEKPIPMNLTRITVDYTRQLVALADQLIFEQEAGGANSFRVSGFANGDPKKAFVWDISNPRLPKRIKMNDDNIVASGANYIYLFGRDHLPNARFIATTDENVLEVKSLTEYVPVSIAPPSGGARWLAITHKSLRDAANKLAVYRHRQMGAYVVNMENVVNQVGYGFNTPETIRQYLRIAITDWKIAPDYVTLFGDATNNPRNLDCVDCGKNWHKDTPTLIVTEFKFIDRWQGMIPSDFAMSLLFGDDLIPDIAISRIPAYTNEEASFMVEKVINYETQREETLQDWQKNFLFVADDLDKQAGNFCSENLNTGLLLPDTYNQTHLCLLPEDDEGQPTPEEINDLRVEMRRQISDIGASVVNYRGHGSTTRWAGYNGEPPILSADDVDFWENSGRSVVVLSADCLDGYFILNFRSALGETFLRLNNRGSVAHWSSAGLGYTYEHRILHNGFYEGMFKYNQNALGDAVNFAKIRYYQSGNHPSELFGFILLGDAAMAVVPKELAKVFLPVTIVQ